MGPRGFGEELSEVLGDFLRAVFLEEVTAVRKQDALGLGQVAGQAAHGGLDVRQDVVGGAVEESHGDLVGEDRQALLDVGEAVRMQAGSRFEKGSAGRGGGRRGAHAVEDLGGEAAVVSHADAHGQGQARRAGKERRDSGELAAGDEGDGGPGQLA